MDPDRIHRILDGRATDLAARLARSLAACAEPAYTVAVAARNRRFDRGWGVAYAHCPVTSVGNITTGGTGKTPMVAWLCGAIHRAGFRPAVLTRGYRGREDTSDEIELLRQLLGSSVPVVRDADRVRAASRVAREHPNVNWLVLDDGFQHRRLHRDFDLVLVDATMPFGYERLLPRGLLREPLQSLHRAHAIVITRSDAVDAASLAKLDQRIGRLAAGRPVYRARLEPRSIAWESLDHPPTWLEGRPVLAFCGIANPDSFYALLARAGATIIEHVTFADHHAFGTGEIDTIVRRALELRAVPVTTSKDAVRLTSDHRSRVAVVHTAMHLLDNHGAELIRMITRR